MSKKPLHRKEKQDDAEELAIRLQTCCAYSNSALVEDGVCAGANEYYFRVVEHYINIDDAKPNHLEDVAKILEVLAEQFRTCAENIKEFEGDDDDERMEAREDESRKE
jgi:hypothetical protein